MPKFKIGDICYAPDKEVTLSEIRAINDSDYLVTIKEHNNISVHTDFSHSYSIGYWDSTRVLFSVHNAMVQFDKELEELLK